MPSPPIGGGVFVAIVGPSGAGKDSVIAFARDALRTEALPNEAHIHFPVRAITRNASDGAEAHEPMAAETFERLRRDGGFALSWRAHGCGYGIPAAVDEQIGRGGIVVANLSRTVVPTMRERYATSLVVEITAPLDILENRIAGRGRESGAAVKNRLKRSSEIVDVCPTSDLVIDNSGPLEDAGGRLLALLRSRLARETDREQPNRVD